MRAFVNDVKAACTNADAGYEDVAPFIIGSISNTIDILVESFQTATKSGQIDKIAYLGYISSAAVVALLFLYGSRYGPVFLSSCQSHHHSNQILSSAFARVLRLGARNL
jgi:hypothetical protein